MIVRESKKYRDDRSWKQRRRQPHKKSRSGCANCRFRRVKCDEIKPICRMCKAYMVPCSYINDAPDLASVYERIVVDSHMARSTPVSDLDIPLCSPLHPLPKSDWKHEVIFRFQKRTVLTMGSLKTTPAYADTVPRLAMQHAYLLHIVVATTLLHDRALNGLLHPQYVESFHLSQAAAQFNQKLSTEINDQDRDALWATAVYMCMVAVFNILTTEPEEAWPLKSNDFDLEWLHFQAGLRIIWAISDLQRPDGAFRFIDQCMDQNCVFPRTPEPGIVGLPTLLVKLCELHDSSDGSNNLYHTAVRHLSWLLPMQCTNSNLLTFMVFAGGMTKSYRDLLYRKDPRALLLLAIWYSKLFNSCWWMIPRAVVECRAILIYLSRLQIKTSAFQEAVKFVEQAYVTQGWHSADRDEQSCQKFQPALRLASVESQ